MSHNRARNLRPRFRLALAAGLQFLLLPGAASADTDYLGGIHWYPTDTASTEVEDMTGGRAAWVVDQALLDSTATIAAPNPWETPWVTSPSVDKTQPWAKVFDISAVTDKGHTAIMRLHPWWGVNVPYPGDPYTNADFAEDCKAAASLMRNVHIWQIGNEANLNGEQTRWDAATQRYQLAWPNNELQQTPELYADTYLACRAKIHEVVPLTSPATQIVLMQPCSPGNPVAGTRFMSSDEFLTRMIAAVPDKSQIDGFALHSYAKPGAADYGAIDFMNDLRRQIAIIDQAGLGNRPIFITEFNKHMPNPTEATSGARFIGAAYTRLNNWNSGAPAMWPAQANHPIRGTAWFVYRAGAGWDDYSLQHWKTVIPSTSSNENPWYAFKSMCSLGLPAGNGSGPEFTGSSQWWSDAFDGPGLSSLYPLPAWDIEKAAGTLVSVTDGAARIAATSSFQAAGIKNAQIPFADFSMEAEISFTNPAPVAAGEANVDIRFRQQGDGGPGFSLTLYSDQSSVRPGQAWLRKTAFWDTVYQSGPVAGGIAAGDAFKVQVSAVGETLSIRILKLPGNTPVLEWLGSGAVSSTDFRVGGISVVTYNMQEARVQNFRMGGPEMLELSAPVDTWPLYE